MEHLELLRFEDPQIIPYEDISGKSGLKAFQVSEDGTRIIVEWKGGARWEYDCTPEVIELAFAGAGLCTYVNQNLKHTGIKVS